MKRIVATEIGLVILGVFTGFFLSGGIKSSQEQQTFNIQTSTENQTLNEVQGNYIHSLVTTVVATETTPHAWVHNFAANLSPSFQKPGTASISLPGPNQIYAQNREFRPMHINVTAGTTVAFINKDMEEHTVTSVTGLFNGIMPVGSSFNFTFSDPGTYQFYCEPHRDMIGTVIVTAAP